MNYEEMWDKLRREVFDKIDTSKNLAQQLAYVQVVKMMGVIENERRRNND